MASEINIFYILLLIISVIVYKYIKYVYSYWERYGVRQLKPKFPFGNFGPNFLQRISIGDMIAEMYNSTTESFIGVYSVLKPSLLIRDPELIHSICVEDFQCFMGRGVYFDEKHDPMTAHLFTLEGEKWKLLRTKLTPTFTPSKVKNMFPIIDKIGDTLQETMNKLINDVENHFDNDLVKNGFIDIREIVARYTTDIIASVGFGIEINSIENTEEEFRKCGRKIFATNFRNGMRFLLFTVWPKFFKILRMKMYKQSTEDFITNVVKKNLEYREKNNISRPDFFQYLIELRNNKNTDEDMTIDVMIAQTFIFFIAGFETTSTTMGFFLYEMARHQDTQKKVQEEIDQILKQHNDQLTFDSISEMIYLDWCIDETLRLYPALPFLNRISTKSYTIPNSNVNIEKGVPIVISALGLQRDPKYYPNPNKFIPERFSPENIVNKTFTEMPYLPFGLGPKNCIGLRLGKLQTKIGLVKLLQNFKYHLTNDQTKSSEDDYLEFSPAGFMLAPKHELLLKITKR